MKVPKRIWADVNPDEFYQTWSAKKSEIIDTDVQYIRADLVDPLVTELNYVSCLYRGHQAHYEAKGDMRRAEANAARAKTIEDALKELRKP